MPSLRARRSRHGPHPPGRARRSGTTRLPGRSRSSAVTCSSRSGCGHTATSRSSPCRSRVAQSLAEYGLRQVTVVPEGWVPGLPCPGREGAGPDRCLHRPAERQQAPGTRDRGLRPRPAPVARRADVGDRERPGGGAAAQAGGAGRDLPRARARGSETRAPGTGARPGHHVGPRGLGTGGDRGGGERNRRDRLRRSRAEGLDRSVRRRPHAGRSWIPGGRPGRAAPVGGRRLRTRARAVGVVPWAQVADAILAGSGYARSPVTGTRGADGGQRRGVPLRRAERPAGRAGHIASLARVASRWRRLTQRRSEEQ